MIVVIAGSRTIRDYELVKKYVLQSRFKIDEVVNGCARGVDYMGVLFAQEYGLRLKNFVPDWDKYGRAAGNIRNGLMADYADAAIIINQTFSRGAANMHTQMVSRNKRYYTVHIDEDGKVKFILMDKNTEKDHNNGRKIIDITRKRNTKNQDGILQFSKPTS